MKGSFTSWLAMRTIRGAGRCVCNAPTTSLSIDSARRRPVHFSWTIRSRPSRDESCRTSRKFKRHRPGSGSVFSFSKIGCLEKAAAPPEMALAEKRGPAPALQISGPDARAGPPRCSIDREFPGPLRERRSCCATNAGDRRDRRRRRARLLGGGRFRACARAGECGGCGLLS